MLFEDKITRNIIFFFFCIGIRVLIPFIIKKKEIIKYKLIISLILFIIGFSFILIRATNSRKVGIETGNKPIWWDNLRPIHGLLYLLSSYFVYTDQIDRASKTLLFDVYFGLSAKLGKTFFDIKY
jgi:hypothetical protein